MQCYLAWPRVHLLEQRTPNSLGFGQRKEGITLMHLPSPISKRLAQEYKFVAERIQAESSLQGKLYFFSAFYGEANRALNLAWDTNLALAHMVLQNTYQTIFTRVQAMAAGGEPFVALPASFPQELTECSVELATLFQSQRIEDAALEKILARFAELAYIATGNGYYLYVKGAIKLSS